MFFSAEHFSLPDNSFNGKVLHLRIHSPRRTNGCMNNMVCPTTVVMTNVVALTAVAYGAIAIVACTLHTIAGGNSIFLSRATILKQLDNLLTAAQNL